MLAEVIMQTIRDNGPISFHDYMEMCLYYPELGYYTSANEKIGAKGDYYTSAYLTPVFGAMIGTQLEEMWHALGEGKFTVVEYGAGAGRMTHDILEYLKNNKQLYDQLQYCIIEKSPAMREKQRSHLLEKVSWYDSISDIGDVIGCVLSNELIDNFPIHQVVMEDDLMEVFVDYADGFVERFVPASQQLKDYLRQLDIFLPKGFRTEINLQAVRWVQEIADALKRGYVLTIDYGYSSIELYSGRRKSGTVMCYHKHKVHSNPYDHIGEQDITAHVNFSALYHWGTLKGLNCCGFTNQGHFLRGAGITDYIRRAEQAQQGKRSDGDGNASLVHTLLMDMGSKLKVLVQQKGMQSQLLSSLMFAERYV